jgi:hypothetical protein
VELAAVAVLVVSENAATGDVAPASRTLMTRYERGVHRAFELLASVAEEKRRGERAGPRRRRLGLSRAKRSGGK